MTARRRGRPAIDWTAEMLARLRELREHGVALQICADALGVDYGVLRKRARIEGLANRLNRGPLAGETLRRQG